MENGMESRLTQVRSILNRLVDLNGGDPSHGGKKRFWNLPRDQFLAGPIYGKTPIVPGRPDDSFLLKILKGPAEGFARMPLGGPYIQDNDWTFISQWIADGAPDDAAAFTTAIRAVIKRQRAGKKRHSSGSTRK
jgi:hypothetical protein